MGLSQATCGPRDVVKFVESVVVEEILGRVLEEVEYIIDLGSLL